MVDWIQPGKTIGIVGGGSISRLLALAAKKLGYKIGILDPNETCQAKNVADWHLVADFTDEESFRDLAMKSDVVIYEMEAFDSDFVRLMQRTVPVPQGEDLLTASQDRVFQKAFLESVRLNIAPFATIVTVEDIEEAASSIGYPCVLKANRVDERFNQHVILYSEEDIEKAKKILHSGTCVLEAWIPKERELCLAVAKDGEGKIVTYPVTETLYREENLYQTITPARIDQEMAEEIKRIGRSIAQEMDFVGVIAVELFATSTGSLYVNELVAHPHEAFHFTQEAASLSQYEAHIRAICGMPLPDQVTIQGDVLTVPFHQAHIETIYQQTKIKPNWTFTFYGEENQTLQKEVGYITIQTDHLNKTLDLLSDIELWK